VWLSLSVCVCVCASFLARGGSSSEFYDAEFFFFSHV